MIASPCARRWQVMLDGYALRASTTDASVLALGLEGTLFAHVGPTVVARPFLHQFLESCAELFDSIVVFYDHEFRAAAEQLLQQGPVPGWFVDVDGIAWDGRFKDLTRAGAFDFKEVLIIDDTPRFLTPAKRSSTLP